MSSRLRLQLRFGNGLALGGWIAYSAGLLFALLFFTIFEVDTQLYRWRGELATATGTITRVERTHIRHKSGSRRTYYRRFHYRFQTPDGVRRTGKSMSRLARYSPGDRVTIEYPRNDPGVSRIKGMRRSVGGPWFYLLLLIPVIGFILGLLGQIVGRRNITLLRHGLPAKGHLVAKDPTATKINNRTVYKLTFEFQTPDGRTHQAATRTHQPERLEDEVFERLLYHPDTPERAVMMDTLPGRPQIDSVGNFVASRSIWARLSLLPAAAALPATLLFALWFLLL